MKDGQPQRMNERLFMQFLAFGDCADSRALADAMQAAGVPAGRLLKSCMRWPLKRRSAISRQDNRLGSFQRGRTGRA